MSLGKVGTESGFDIGDKADAQKFCAVLGHLWLGSKQINTTGLPTMDLTFGTKLLTEYGVQFIDFMTPKRLPGALDVNMMGSSFVSYRADKGACAFRTSEDDAYNDRMNNLGNPIVVAGALVVAITMGGVDISAELTTTLRIPCGQDENGTQFVNIGFAAASAQEGVYDTPFSNALSFWTGGIGGQRNVPIVVTNGQTKLLSR